MFLLHPFFHVVHYLVHDLLLHDNAVLALLGLSSLLALLNLFNHTLEGSGDVLVVPGTGLCVSALQLLGQLFAVFGLDLSLFWSQIALVSDNDEWDCISTLVIAISMCAVNVAKLAYHVVENLVPDDADHLKALLASNAVDNHVAMDANEVFTVQDCVFVLSTVISAPMAFFSSSD